jgi:cytochrome c peroxidase
VLAVALTLGFYWMFGSAPEVAPAQEAEVQLADSGVLQARYLHWSEGFEANGGSSHLVIPLGWAKGLSNEYQAARGITRFDIPQGRVKAEIPGLPTDSRWDLWVVDNQPGPDRSVMPETGDRFQHLGELQGGLTASLETSLRPGFFDEFEIDLVVLTRSGVTPDQGVVLTGAPRLFERLYIWGDRQMTRTADGILTLAPLSLAPRPAFADTPFNSLDPLIAQGADLFFNETFNGNGRTCATCHPAENNFTVDPRFIASLDDDDPLFVAEQVPALADLENPLLLRELGLFKVNADGFANEAVLRPAQHLLGLSRYLEPGNQAVPPLQRTGWSGDGAPGSGTLREFPIGAVTQHMTQSLDRIPGVDFRLPTDAELDAMEAFLLALGRQDNPDLGAINMASPVAERGRELFLEFALGRANCTFCHAQAGANGPNPALNSNFDIGIESLPDHPGDLIAPGAMPPDGGFGTTPLFDPDTGDFVGYGSFDPAEGNELRFNSQPIIEAVDTGPFFHNHAVKTLEEAIGFYNSDEFGNSPAGGLRSNITSTEIEAIATFLRVMNVLENIRASNLLSQAARSEPHGPTSRRLADLASFDTQDAYQVFEERYLFPDLIDKLRQAYLLERTASKTPAKPLRNYFLGQAVDLKDDVAADLLAP